ncbi:hypothetical protein LZ31DRAFT_373504 [Colletotrichum somersetense]|nr:hypothetical protein LZ31DRAFT_373504 [Colletotrichum somersetense]
MGVGGGRLAQCSLLLYLPLRLAQLCCRAFPTMFPWHLLYLPTLPEPSTVWMAAAKSQAIRFCSRHSSIQSMVVGNP